MNSTEVSSGHTRSVYSVHVLSCTAAVLYCTVNSGEHSSDQTAHSQRYPSGNLQMIEEYALVAEPLRGNTQRRINWDELRTYGISK